MNNLHIFAIGGSGERVMYSLVMQLAAGMKINASKIYPIFVDNDAKSPALTKTRNLISYYNKQATNNDPKMGARPMRQAAGDPGGDVTFFSADIDEPKELIVDGRQMNTLTTFTSTNNSELKERIEKERQLLFSKDDLAMPLDAGFIGHPNIGSVILDSQQFQTQDFNDIMDKLGPNDGVMVIGSLFGGTGAAGIPLIINKLNQLGKQSQKGVVAILPYFKTGKNGTHGVKFDVHTDEFDLKTRAALMYYDEHMRDVDYIYYVGDRDNPATYIHSIGGNGNGNAGRDPQNNPAHPIEVMAALSVIDFANQVKPNSVIYKIPTWNFDKGSVNDSNLSDCPFDDFRRAVVKFQMLKNLFKYPTMLKNDIDEHRSFVENLGIDASLVEAVQEEVDYGNRQGTYPQSWGLNHIFKEWDKWLDDLIDKGGECGSKRKMAMVNKEMAVDEDNFTQVFFTNNDWGVAKVVQKGVFKKSLRPQDSEIKDMLEEGGDIIRRKNLFKENVEEKFKLSLLIRELSLGLDKVISENCTI